MEALEALAEPPPVLALSSDETEQAQVAAARGGARGFLPKSQAAALLPQALRAVARGELWFTPQVAAQIFREYQQLVRRRPFVASLLSPADPLSGREREILVRIARGMTNPQIARELFLSVHTVKLHVQKILRKLNLPNRTEAAVYAVRQGLLEPIAN